MIWLLSHHLRKNHCNRQIQCLCKKRWLCFHSFHCPEFAEKMKILSYKEKHIYHLWFIVSNLICLLSIVWISLCLKISEIKIYIYIYAYIIFVFCLSESDILDKSNSQLNIASCYCKLVEIEAIMINVFLTQQIQI